MIMQGTDRRKIVAAAPLTGVLGIFAVAATDLKHGLVTAGFVLVALIVAENL
jgi:hypothetical protein